MLVNLKVFIVEFKSLVKSMMKHSHHLIPKRDLKMIDKRFLDINAFIKEKYLRGVESGKSRQSSKSGKSSLPRVTNITFNMIFKTS